jgi:phospholipase C
MGSFYLAMALAILQLATALPSNIQYHEDDASWRSKIKNVVVLVEENRSFDTFCGGLTYNDDIAGLLHHNYCNSM